MLTTLGSYREVPPAVCEPPTTVEVEPVVFADAVGTVLFMLCIILMGRQNQRGE